MAVRIGNTESPWGPGPSQPNSAVRAGERLEDLLERRNQLRRVLCIVLPDDVFIHAKVVVNAMSSTWPT